MTNEQKANVWAEKLRLTAERDAEPDKEAKAAIQLQIERCNQQLIQNKLDVPETTTNTDIKSL